MRINSLSGSKIFFQAPPRFSARYMAPLQWSPEGGTAEEEEGGLGGLPQAGGGAGDTKAQLS
jgi:hypothetical protein